MLLSLLLSATLSTKLTGLTWIAAISLTAIFSFTLSKDHTVSSWANVVCLAIFGFVLFVTLPTLPKAFVILAGLALGAIAGYLTWKQEWYRVKDWQRGWLKLCDRTRDNMAGHPVWKSYGMLIGTNWLCLILGKIVWGLAISQGLIQ